MDAKVRNQPWTLFEGFIVVERVGEIESKKAKP